MHLDYSSLLYKPLKCIDNLSRAIAPHSHSIVLRHANPLNTRCKFFMRTPKHRPLDPSENRALDFKGEFRRSAICPVSETIDVDWSIFLEVLREGGAFSLSKKTVSDGDARILSY
jgi:hypothetical protein